tara:strand:+ start:2419 stop:2895 length:477 start_codon:yes stop_codon:yes gene_type:complete
MKLRSVLTDTFNNMTAEPKAGASGSTSKTAAPSSSDSKFLSSLGKAAGDAASHTQLGMMINGGGELLKMFDGASGGPAVSDSQMQGLNAGFGPTANGALPSSFSAENAGLPDWNSMSSLMPSAPDNSANIDNGEEQTGDLLKHKGMLNSVLKAMAMGA